MSDAVAEIDKDLEDLAEKLAAAFAPGRRVLVRHRGLARE
jgi:hypothetical protein